jgi:hypothetical protein
MHVWDGVVETFQLDGHPKTKRAYAWVTPSTSKKEEPQYTIILGLPPVNSAQDAVKVAVLGGCKKLIQLAEQILEGKKQ